MKSMTGYGVSRWKTDDCYIEVVVQSYNNKHFESRLQMPPFYASLEGELRKVLQKNFARGFISLLVTRNSLWKARQTTMQWNKKQALKWKAIYNQMALAMKMKNNLDLLHLSQQPGVLEVLSSSSALSLKEKNKLKALVHKSIELCKKERDREGTALKRDFQKNLKQLSMSLQKVKSHSAGQSKRVYKNIKDKITAITDDKKTRLEVIGALISRMDTSEEISRMIEHIQAFRALVSTEGVIGKNMSFYLQEMVREVNTIGSKSQDFKLTQEVVQAKGIIEKMREQVQNIE